MKNVNSNDAQGPIAAESLFARLAERGIDYVFANAGTDFAPMVEALARNAGTIRKFPRVLTVPHENVAMGMAHGYYRVSGKPAVVMVHVTVGTANAINGLMNAARDHVPVLLAAGRTPLTETGHIASRNRSIHWGQEMFDQGSLVREFVKWDYELRAGQPVESLVDRALDIAMSEPRGPVYLTLPREVLANPAVPARRQTVRPLGAVAAAPALSAIDQTAHLIADAEYPLIVTSSLGRRPGAITALAALAEEFAIPIVQNDASDFNLPSNHAMNLGFNVAVSLSQADVVVVLDCAVPWIPRTHKLRNGAKIIHVGVDPLLTCYPFRDFEADLLVSGDSAAALSLLREALRAAMKGKKADAVERRRKAIAAMRDEMQAMRLKLIDQVKNQRPVHPAYLAHCLNQVKSNDAIIVNELGVPIGLLDLTQPCSYISHGTAGGLGFALGAGLGAKLAAPEREVIATVGDGSYQFGNPLSYHFVGRAEKLPTLTIVSNNQAWHAVRQATIDVYPNGHATKANVMSLVELKPSPAFEKVIESCGGRGERVETSDALLPALQRSFEAIRSGTPALLNVSTQNRS